MQVGVGITRNTSAPANLLTPLILLLAALSEGLLPQEGAHVAGTQLALPLLLILGTGCVGYLALRAMRSPWESPFGGDSWGAPPKATEVYADPEPSAHGRWPLLVALLLGPFVFLFAGLGGWVEGRPPFQRSSPAFRYSAA